MLLRIAIGIALFFLATGTSRLVPSTYSVQIGVAVYIRADGSVDPSTAPIMRDGDRYTLVGNIASDSHGIRIEKSDVTVNGAGYLLEGLGGEDTLGISLVEKTNVTIRNFRIKNFSKAIYLYFCSNCNIIGNTIANTTSGIELIFSPSCYVRENMATNNADGIILVGSSDCSFRLNNVSGNTHCGVYLVDSSSNRFYENTAVNNSGGIISKNSPDCIFQENNLADNGGWGISLGGSSQYVHRNLILNNVYGIMLSSRHFSIQENNITSNGVYGIRLDFSFNGSIQRNTILGSTYGIYLSLSANNTIVHNNLLNNSQQVYVEMDRWGNAWNNGYPSGGNYWGDYSGADLCYGPHQNETGSDGIGDLPYAIDETNQDNYPLMNAMLPVVGDVNGDDTVDTLDCEMVAFAFGSRPNDLNWKPNVDINGDELVDIFDLVVVSVHFGETS